jgi:hypothetical protein
MAARGKNANAEGKCGHPRHERVPFAADEIDDFPVYRDSECPCCGGLLHDVDLAPQTLQEVDIEEILIRVREHRSIAQQCSDCHQLHFASFPPELVRAGLVGPRLTALVGFLKGACHMSFSAIRKFFRDVIGFRISRGQLQKLIGKVTTSLQDPFEELLKLLPQEDQLNVDETGHKDNGKRLWTWCFRATMFTLFKISPSRGSNVLLEVLGEEFDGVLGCDYFSAYRKYMRLNENVSVQFCLAHLIRDVKFLAQHPDPRNRAYGERLLEHFRNLFHIIHRREEESGGSLLPAHRQLLSLHHDSRHRADQQLGGTSDPFRRHPSSADARNSRPSRTNLVRTDLDGDRHLRATRSKCLSLPGGSRHRLFSIFPRALLGSRHVTPSSTASAVAVSGSLGGRRDRRRDAGKALRPSRRQALVHPDGSAVSEAGSS